MSLFPLPSEDPFYAKLDESCIHSEQPWKKDSDRHVARLELLLRKAQQRIGVVSYDHSRGPFPEGTEIAFESPESDPSAPRLTDDDDDPGEGRPLLEREFRGIFKSERDFFAWWDRTSRFWPLSACCGQVET